MSEKRLKIKKMNCLIVYVSSFDRCGKKRKPILQIRVWINVQINKEMIRLSVDGERRDQSDSLHISGMTVLPPAGIEAAM